MDTPPLRANMYMVSGATSPCFLSRRFTVQSTWVSATATHNGKVCGVPLRPAQRQWLEKNVLQLTAWLALIWKIWPMA
ncbi:hypothetical protein D3C76_1436260 [compost metagenome]